MDLIDRTRLAQEVETARAKGWERDPTRLIRWAHELLGERLMMSTAFGKSGMVILHMVRDIVPRLPVYFLDTGFHFAETMAYTERLREEWNVNLILKRPKLYGDAFKQSYGEKLHDTDPDLCCHKNKVEPFAEILEEYQGWITGVRRDQGSTRAQSESLEILEGGKLKIQPLVHWERLEVEAYIKKHDLPLHPLFSQGYTSIGCAPCTRPALDPNDERSGRWAGLAKKECGLQTSWRQKDKVEFVGKLASSSKGKRPQPQEADASKTASS